MISPWRTKAQAVIRQVQHQHGGCSYALFKRCLMEAYPFHERSMHPYKIWLDEQRKALTAHPESPKHKENNPLLEWREE